MELLLGLICAGWFVCAILGAVIADRHKAAGTGCLLGLIFGPLGVIAAFAAEGRPQCPKCLGRLEGHASVWQHCQTKILWRGGRAYVGEQIEKRLVEERERAKRREERAQATEERMREAAAAALGRAWRGLLRLPGAIHCGIGELVGRENTLVWGFVEILLVIVLAGSLAALLGFAIVRIVA